MRVSLKGMTMLLCICVFLMGNAPVCFGDDLTQVEEMFTRAEAYSGWVTVPGKGEMRYYAQNDTLWGHLTYESEGSGRSRPFRDSGCSPASAAMAIAALVPEEALPRIADYAKKEYSLCACSLNRGKCNNRRHARYVLTSQRDFTRFLPLVLGDFAAGNNTFGAMSRSEAAGTGTGYLKYAAQVYGLQCTLSTDYNEAIAALNRGASVVALAARGGAFTNTGHYVLLAHADGERLYILDPLRRESYHTNQSSKIEILQPGLVALTHENVKAALLSSFIIFEK